MRTVIVGSGRAIPPHVVTNDDLSEIMDTSDAWIQRRCGIERRHFVDPGTTTSDLAAEAVRDAASDAQIELATIDAIVSATMTPDLIAPGIAGLVQDRLGITSLATYDIRHQCSGFLVALDIADALVRSGKAATIAVVGAEVHSGYLPWDATTWAYLRGESTDVPNGAQQQRATTYRDWSVLFGDGAGAVIVQASEDESTGIIDVVLHTDGSALDLIMFPGVGSRHRPYVDAAQLEADLHLPTMRGRELFRAAVTAMPTAIHEVADRNAVSLDDIDLVLAHQANARIVDAVAKALGTDRSVVPVNIAEYGNTTAATLPILYDELNKSGRIASGSLLCFAAFGAGAHWGAALYRNP